MNFLVSTTSSSNPLSLIGDIFHPLLVLVGSVLAFIYGVIPNYAIAIALLTIVIMALLTPLTIKSTRSMIAMQSIQPELQKLRAKYKGPDNRVQLQEEMMKLYKEQGVSPVGGCLPMFLQMPALYILYDVIRGLTNTIAKGTLYPKGTVLATGVVAGAKQKCIEVACAVPRYIPSGSSMYKHVVATPGVLNSFGLNLALKPLTHHAHFWDYLPYLAFVAVSVSLQYLQMSQMTKRNPAAAQANPQMAQMQKIMPIMFIFFYLLIPAGALIYMMISSAIRIITQDLIFRTGLVAAPQQRELGGGGESAGNGATSKGTAPKSGSNTNGTQEGESAPAGADNSDEEATSGAKPHPRSKNKKERRSR